MCSRHHEGLAPGAATDRGGEAGSTIKHVTTFVNGTYLGECLVHCDETVTVSPEKLTYSLTSRLEDARNPDITVETAPAPELWEKLERALDPVALSALPDRIALPDADDSGGEFLEVSFDGQKKRVDFPRDADVPEIASLLRAVRELRARLAAEHRR
jgi:hypothetical protein